MTWSQHYYFEFLYIANGLLAEQTRWLRVQYRYLTPIWWPCSSMDFQSVNLDIISCNTLQTYNTYHANNLKIKALKMKLTIFIFFSNSTKFILLSIEAFNFLF